MAGFAVFWDIENCGFPNNISSIDVINNISDLRFPENNEVIDITRFGIYGAEKCLEKFKDHTIDTSDGIIIPKGDKIPRIKCNISLFPVKDTDPDSKRKADQADKKILADMLLYALDCKSGDSEVPVGIVLITSDIDFQYSVEQLTKRGCCTVLLHGRNTKKPLVQAAAYRADWYGLVRNMLGVKELRVSNTIMKDDTRKIKIPQKNWLKDLEVALETLLEDKLIVNDKNIRASLKIDGREKDEIWEEIKKISGVNEKIKQAISEQKEMEHYDPTTANWDKFSISDIKELYSTLTNNREQRKNGKYPMAKFLKESTPNPKAYPLGKVLEFVQLSINLGWINYSGRVAIINPTILQAVPFDQISAYDPTKANQGFDTNRQVVALSTAKSALQHYFQKMFKTLPRYESRREGPDHLPLFQASVHVPLPSDKFKEEYFYATGKASTKKEAEKNASQQACTQILQYLPDFRFPNDYLETN